MKLLVTGGAGYIGSHFVRHALNLNNEIIIIDDLSSGHEWAIPSSCEFLNINLLNKEELFDAFKKIKVDGVIHFAAKSIVSESIKNPAYYYQNNIIGSINLLHAMLENDIHNIVFSSSAAVYGDPNSKKIKESHEKKPINPYGRSKLIIENILSDYCNAYDLNAISLRYFNAAGADINANIGECHKPETHLIPNILNSIIDDNEVKIFGSDYPTKDGTCIRDYVHVDDLADAHLKSIQKIDNLNGFNDFNLGNSSGFSILEIIEACKKITSRAVKYNFSERRKGDPPILIADNKKAQNVLGWRPSSSNIDNIISTAWNWHKNNKQLF